MTEPGKRSPYLAHQAVPAHGSHGFSESRRMSNWEMSTPATDRSLLGRPSRNLAFKTSATDGGGGLGKGVGTVGGRAGVMVKFACEAVGGVEVELRSRSASDAV
eukprot:652794-Pleurochrysis_carterae.AAC.5